MIAKSKTNNGFTLVELSIVLVIIGLLIGGILSAQSMISTVKIQTQVKQFQQFDIAVRNFTGKYRYIPGDCPPQVCGGYIAQNGNGYLQSEWWTSYVSPPLWWWHEPAAFFRHLSAMGEISETYTEADACKLGKGGIWPELKIGKGGISISGDPAANIYYVTISNATTSVGCVSGPYSDIMINGVLTPAEAAGIDTKTDDGSPGSGDIAAITSTVQSNGYIGTPFVLDTASTCTTGGTAYNAGSSARSCFLSIKSKYN